MSSAIAIVDRLSWPMYWMYGRDAKIRCQKCNKAIWDQIYMLSESNSQVGWATKKHQLCRKCCNKFKFEFFVSPAYSTGNHVVI